MQLNEYGDAVIKEWLKTPELRPNIELDKFIVMPNHLHAIMIISWHMRSHSITTLNTFLRSPSQTVGAIIRGFKSTVTKQLNQIRNLPATPIWQRNYYESIIRNENDLNCIREYIINNPGQWDLDDENPAKHKHIT
nr:transposase [Anabaena sp. PCC 7108]